MSTTATLALENESQIPPFHPITVNVLRERCFIFINSILVVAKAFWGIKSGPIMPRRPQWLKNRPSFSPGLCSYQSQLHHRLKVNNQTGGELYVLQNLVSCSLWKTIAPKTIFLSTSTHFRSGHRQLNASLNRFRLNFTGLCHCSAEETVEQFVLYCLFNSARASHKNCTQNCTKIPYKRN